MAARTDPLKRRTDRLLLLLWLGLEADLWRLTQEALQGARSPYLLPTALREALLQAHLAAAALGWQRGAHGQTLPPKGIPAALAQRVAQEQTRYLQGFAEDVRTGRYRAHSRGLRWRSHLYANRLVGTANAAWREAVADASATDEAVRLAGAVGEPLVLWVLGDAREHCDTCQTEAKAGWRRASTLERVPGDGTTECNVGCTCALRTQAGVRSFSLRDLKDAAIQLAPPGGILSVRDLNAMRRRARAG